LGQRPDGDVVFERVVGGGVQQLVEFVPFEGFAFPTLVAL